MVHKADDEIFEPILNRTMIVVIKIKNFGNSRLFTSVVNFWSVAIARRGEK